MGAPWFDAAGRFSPFKTAVLAALCVPAAAIAYHWLAGTYAARPVQAIINAAGLCTIWLLVATLALSPAQQIFRAPAFGAVRRMTGVAAFCYAGLHFMAFAADKMFDLRTVASEIVLRIYLTIGMATLTMLLLLAATSTDGMMRRLGGRRWRRLHRLVYAAALLGTIHFFMQSKLDVTEPTIVAGLLLWLMGWRALRAVSRVASAHPTALGALALAASALTMAGEALYFYLRSGVDPLLVIMANFDLQTGLRPGWIVLAVMLPVAIAAAIRRRVRLPAPAR